MPPSEAEISSNNTGRHPRHEALNDIANRALYRAGIPYLLGPVGTDIGDGPHPDGMTAFPLRNCTSLCWDTTCVNTFAGSSVLSLSHLDQQLMNRDVANVRNIAINMARRFQFEPLVIETMGTFGETAVKKTSEATADN